jgi:hypothetical protein
VCYWNWVFLEEVSYIDIRWDGQIPEHTQEDYWIHHHHKQQGMMSVSHLCCGLLPFTLTSVLKPIKKKNYGNSNIFTMQNIIFPKKNPSKINQNPSGYFYNSIITNLKFHQHKPKLSSFKNSHLKIDRPIIYLFIT